MNFKKKKAPFNIIRVKKLECPFFILLEIILAMETGRTWNGHNKILDYSKR
jgi:hypothetical protein